MNLRIEHEIIQNWLVWFQILFTEFVDWALEKNLDIEDDIDEAEVEAEKVAEEAEATEEAAE